MNLTIFQCEKSNPRVGLKLDNAPEARYLGIGVGIYRRLLKATEGLFSSLLFHAGQAAIKLPSAEASNLAQCTSPGQYTPYIK